MSPAWLRRWNFLQRNREMSLDPTIARIREARHRISEKCGHDPRKLVDYYLALQEEQYADRLVKTPKAMPTAEKGKPE